MNRLKNIENRRNFGGHNGSNFLLIDSWREFIRDKKEIAKVDNPGMYKLDYKTMTRVINTDLDIGVYRKENKEMKDEEYIRRYKEKYKLCENTRIIFTDASKSEDNISVGVAIVIVGEETAYSVSIDKRCSVYTGELLGVEEAIGYAIDNMDG